MKALWNRIRNVNRTGLGAWGLLACILALQYLGGWYGLQLARISKENELERHLADLGRVAPLTLRGPALALADLALDARWAAVREAAGTTFGTQAALNGGILNAGEDIQPDPDAYQQGLTAALTDPLRRFASEARLTKIVVLGEAGRVLYDTAEPARALTTFDFVAIDRQEIARAEAGEAASSPAYSLGDAAYKRYYVPLREPAASAAAPAATGNGESPKANDQANDNPENDINDNPTTGPVRVVLCLVAGRTYLDEIDRLGDRLRHLNLLLTLLMLGVGALIWRLLARQRRIERQAAEADRLAGLGTLAAGFAHELRNPLEIVRAFTEDLERGLATDGSREEAQEACRDIIEEVDRMNRLVGQFLSYSRGASAGGAAVAGGMAPLLATAGQVMAMLQPQAQKRGIRLALEAGPGGGGGDVLARLDAGALKQVLINLLLNALQASPEGGRVLVSVKSAGGRMVEARVRDEGPGVPEKDRRRIFEPFFSTRSGGSGLGLAVCRQIATQAGGTLELAEGNGGRDGGGSRNGRGGSGEGACFILRLPVANATIKTNDDGEVTNVGQRAES